VHNPGSALTPRARFRVAVEVQDMRSGELANRAGVSTKTVRYYERSGLIARARAVNGYREFGEDHLRLVAEIRDWAGAATPRAGPRRSSSASTPDTNTATSAWTRWPSTATPSPSWTA
jgi:hypothetical protein